MSPFNKLVVDMEVANDGPVAVTAKQSMGMPMNPIEIDSSSDDNDEEEDEGYGVNSVDRKPLMVTAIVYLETGMLQLVLDRTSPQTQREFFETVVAKKVAIRHNIPGYTTCVREMLLKYRHMRESFFSVFFPALYGEVPSGDITWGGKLSRSAHYQLVSFMYVHYWVFFNLHFFLTMH
jgi:hypothetical protein